MSSLPSDHGVQASCTLLHLFEALSDTASRTYDSGSTQTLDQHTGRPIHPDPARAGTERNTLMLESGHDMDVRMRQVEEAHALRSRSELLYPTQGSEERMAFFRQEVEEQARAEIIRQVSLC